MESNVGSDPEGGVVVGEGEDWVGEGTKKGTEGENEVKLVGGRN